MALDRQINLYTVDTGHFYSNRERNLHWKNATFRRERNGLMKRIQELEELLLLLGYTPHDMKDFKHNRIETMKYIPDTSYVLLEYHKLLKLKHYKNTMAKKTKDMLLLLLSNKVKQNELTNGKHHVRVLNETLLSESDVISLFESSLTRMMGIAKDELTSDLLIVQIYYFDVFKDISYYGFQYKGELYRYFTSSAGQIRKKKAVFMKQSAWETYEKTIMCGLTIDTINQKGGNNVNKHLAYMALTNSATDEWNDFDIDRTIVIDDFETNVFGTYDLISDEDYSITRTTGNVPITHTDGAGMVLFGKNRMIRAPWIKGLLGVFDFHRFILEARERYNDPTIGIIQDIYGKEHDIISEHVYVIFTKSQFKMHKYYDSWDEYKEYFKTYHCSAGICNVEEDRIKNTHINYQMLQTLTDTTKEELLAMADKSIQKLNNMCSSIETMQAVFGVTPYNTNMSPLQQAIKQYPNLMNDEYFKITLREIKDSLIKKYKSGKLEIEGKYTFILPDFYAACEYWFLHIEHPNGLLNNQEVYCSLFKKKEKLDCLRSPHLFKEHAIRFNMAHKEYVNQQNNIRQWFTTNAIYTSCHDLISKILQFDVDGDKSLVVADDTILPVAERNMKDIVPLYYNMKKATPTKLNHQNLYQGLHAAFTGGNIGIYSNNIAKIWNDDVFVHSCKKDKEAAIHIVKLLCMENNFVIDYAKTLYKPQRPTTINEQITPFTKKNLPHFFLYAKEKTEGQIEKTNKSLVNQLEDIIPNVRINTRKIGLGTIDYRLLMNNPSIRTKKQVIETYERLNSLWHFKVNMKDEKHSNLSYLACELRNTLSANGCCESDVCDMLVKHLYKNNHKRKETLWFCYGEYIVENLEKNVRHSPLKAIQCIDCSDWFEIDSKNNQTERCPTCYQEFRKEYLRLKKREQRKRAKLNMSTAQTNEKPPTFYG